MALITCQECGKEISDKATACPNCGCPITEPEKNVENNGGIQNSINPSPMVNYNIPPHQIPTPKKESSLGIVGLVISFIMCIPIFPLIGLILCIIAVRDKTQKTICAKIGIVLSIIFLILGSFIWGSDSDTSNNNESVSTNVEDTSPSLEENDTATSTPTPTPTPSETSEPEVAPLPSESKEDFIATCEEISYKTLARYPDDNIGKRFVLTVQINQIVQGGWFDSSEYYRVYTDNDGYGFYYGDEYFMYDCRIDDTTKLLEDDIITVYAEFAGMQSVTRALTGTTEDVPAFKAYYIDILDAE